MDDRAGVTRRSAIMMAGSVLATSAVVGTAWGEGADMEGKMITLFERDTVENYDTWARAFADFAPDLKAAGVVSSVVYQSVDDPNNITVAHDFATLEEAKAFLASADLKAARPGAGVETAPTVWFATKVIAKDY